MANEIVEIPYYLSFAAQSLGASGGKASPKLTVPENLVAFLCQGVVGHGTQASGDNTRHFLLHFESSKHGMWANAGALAEIICGDGRNPGYFLTEVPLAGGDVITAHLENANAAIAYTNVRITLIGRAQKRA